MPKLKPSPIQAQADTVHRNIISRGALFGLKTDADFAKKFNMARSSFAYRRRYPRSWTLDQLVVVSIALKCSLSWLLTDHTGQIGDES